MSNPEEKRRIFQRSAERGLQRGREFVKELRKAAEKGDQKKLEKLRAEFEARKAIAQEPAGIRAAERGRRR